MRSAAPVVGDHYKLYGHAASDILRDTRRCMVTVKEDISTPRRR
jgi:hypothetical protein